MLPSRLLEHSASLMSLTDSTQNSSLRQCTDLYYRKLNTDIYFVDPIAWTPNGKLQREIEVDVEVCEARVSLTITGTRI